MTRRTALGFAASCLRQQEVPFALCGATAMGVFGAARATADIDLVTASMAVLQPGFWEPRGGIRVEVRRGDDSDPLRGVVRIGPHAARPVDVVVPRGRWLASLVARAHRTVEVDGVSVPVVEMADLVLLKLYAGGFFDQQDILALLALDASGEITASIEEHLPELPRDARALWDRLTSAP